MATFLQLCQDAGYDSGLVSRQNPLVTVAGATGKQAEIVSFVRQAWRRIQQMRSDWEFLRGDFTGALVVGKLVYTPVEIGIATRFGRFAHDIPVDGALPHAIYDPALGITDTVPLQQVSPVVWSNAYGRGAQPQGRPGDYALQRGGLYLGPAPDKAYVIKGEYWKAPQELVADGDLPDLPEQFHDVIKWRAIQFVSGKDGAFSDRLVAQAEFSSQFRLLVNDQTRSISLGPTSG